MQDTFKAQEVREILDRIEQQEMAHTDNVSETVEGFARAVVEDGTLTPDAKITTELGLTWRERITGTRTQDVTAMVLIGMMLGTALERDVPMDSALEDAWRDGAFVLPEGSDTTHGPEESDT